MYMEDNVDEKGGLIKVKDTEEYCILSLLMYWFSHLSEMGKKGNQIVKVPVRILSH